MYSSTTYCQINAKFGTKKQIMLRHWGQNTKFYKLKMTDRRHFENSFIATSRPRIIRVRRNLICRCKLWYQECLRDNKNK